MLCKNHNSISAWVKSFVKQTDEDRAFGSEFARQLRPFHKKALADGQTEEQFAKRLGIRRGGLQRYLRSGAMPGFRTIALAHREFGIAIPYGDIDAGTLLPGIAKRRRKISGLQMDLPFTIEAPGGEIDVVIKKKSPQRIRLQIRALKLR